MSHVPSRSWNSCSTHNEEGPCEMCPPRSSGILRVEPITFERHWSVCSATQAAISRTRLAEWIFSVSSGDSEERPNGEDLERRGGCPGSPEWRERDQVEAEGTMCIISKYPCRTWSNKSRTAKKSVSDVGSKYVSSKNNAASPSCCRIRNASLTSASKAVSDVSNSTRL